jgi:prepilin-type N-terminal cleavage/methylation domain-containing protein
MKHTQHLLRSFSPANHAFSLVEVLIVVTIIGIIAFLAIPNVVQVRRDSEDNLARARAEALNVAAVSFVQAVGVQTALADWSPANTNDCYLKLAPYLAFAPSSIADFMPTGYSVNFKPNPHREKADLFRGTNRIYY